MSFSIQTLVQHWAPGRRVSDDVVELFKLIGRDLTERNLCDAVDQSQPWLREQGAERWDIPHNRPDDMARLLELLNKLSLSEPVLPEMQQCDVAAVLGATSYSMQARLEALLKSELDFEELIMLGSERPINDKEVDHLSCYVDNTSDLTEGTAALLMLAHSKGVRTCSAEQVRVLITPNKKGKRATTDDTVTHLINRTNRARFVFVSHQPFGPRQALTVSRVVGNQDLNWKMEFLFGPLSKRVDENPGILVDEVARTLWEMNRLSHDFFA